MSSQGPSSRNTREAKGAFLRSADAARLEFVVEREGGQPSGRTVVLDGDLLRIGSQESNDLVLRDPSVSRYHCRLSRDNRGWRLSDSGSLNGSRLQGVRVYEAELPAPECILELGDARIRVRELAPTTQVAVLDQPRLGDLYGVSILMRKLFAVIDRVSQTDANVLIEGESGTGKELVATEIVRKGPRATKPFVIVDCSAISPNLVESELFGHAKGSFTGADRDRIGAFEAANGGTVFLDEVGELPLDMQPKLLRVLESREVRRVGESETRNVDVRVVAATNRKLDKEVNIGRFREDLYFRLSVMTLRVPSLRERPEDIELLVPVFLEQLAATSSSHLFTPEVFAEMAQYDWPGNVRELRNYIERAVVFQSTEEATLRPSSPPKGEPLVNIEVQFRPAKEQVIADFERRYVAKLLEWAQGNISKASRKAAMDRMNLYRLIQRYGLRESKSFKDEG